VAQRFAILLFGAFGAETMGRIAGSNAARRVAGDSGSCASHDYCDANEVMAGALMDVFGPDVAFDYEGAIRDDACAVWNAAWARFDTADARRWLCDCGDGIRRTTGEASQHFEAPHWEDAAGRLQRHDSTEVNTRL